MTTEFLNDRKSSANILIRLLDDYEILKDFDQNYLQELDDHGILILDMKDSDQNSSYSKSNKWKYRSAR